MRREGNFREADAAVSGKNIVADAAASGKDIMADAVLPALMIMAAILLAICMVLLMVCLLKRRRRHTAALTLPGDIGSITQELPVAEVQAALRTASRPVKILTDIVYCESEEIIP